MAAVEKHPETLAKLPLEGDAVSSARVLDKGDGFLVHVMFTLVSTRASSSRRRRAGASVSRSSRAAPCRSR